MQSIELKSVWQVAWVVRSIDEALPRFSKVFDQGPWMVRPYGPDTVERIETYGEEKPVRWKVAFSTQGSPQIELIEPVEGPSIYQEWLDLHGEGIHHLGFMVDNGQECLRQMREDGYSPILLGTGTGLKGDGLFAYFDFTDRIGTLVELVDPPAERKDPGVVWVAPAP